MSTLFQPGQHPDADQLNAFAEHALPLHEQQATLAHLAACADCRAVVYLAQSAVLETSAQPQPVAAPRPWFSGWMLAFPAAAALACLILLTVHLRNAANANNQIAVVNPAQADKTPPLPPPAPLPEPAVSSKSAPAPVRTPQAMAAPSPRAFGMAKQPEMAAAANAPLEKKSFHGAMTGASYAPVPPPPAAAAPADTIATDAPPQLAGIGGNAPRRELRSASSQYDTGRAQAQQAPPLPPPPPPANANSGIYGGTGQTNLNENYIEGVPTSSASPQAVTGSAADAVTVGALAMDTGAAATSQAKQLPVLPSHLPALSISSNAHRQLAIDTAGALFRSEDAGSTWQPVPVQWTGRAIRVALVPSPNAHLLGRSAGSLSGPLPAAKAAAATSPQPPTFELTTDSGDHWISTDGQAWTRK
ncbi:MAG: zf-HC2 domain-containing protein [Acidobacteriaceae bacterium]|jgi:hypothetical protein